MEPKGSLPYLQVPSTSSCPEPGHSSPCRSRLQLDVEGS
jgi:hypothetical protein